MAAVTQRSEALTPDTRVIDTVAAWHALLRSRDSAALEQLLADEAVFHSPVAHTPQVGKAITLRYLTAAFSVFYNPTFHYLREVVGPRDAVLEFQLELDGITINGVDMLRWRDDGRIVDFKVMLRPLKAVNLIHQKMAGMLQSMA
jgi:ketosteroid isomerase-like protein